MRQSTLLGIARASRIRIYLADIHAINPVREAGGDVVIDFRIFFAVIADENETDMRQTQQDILNLNRLISNPDISSKGGRRNCRKAR